MKTIFTLLLAAALFLPILGQEPDSTEATAAAAAAAAAAEAEAPKASEIAEAPGTPENSEEAAIDRAIDEAIGESAKEPGGDTTKVMGRVEVVESPDKTRVTLGSNEVIIVEENGDSVIVGLGSKGISIVEDGDGVRIKVMDMDSKRSPAAKNHKKKFRPHYAGLNVGLNNYLTPSGSLTLPPEDRYMDLNTGKSWNWNINIAQLGIGLGTNYVGLVTGLGFEFTNYQFNYQNSIIKDPGTGETVEYIPSYAGYISKSKLFMTYLTVPLLLEFQIPTERGRVYISTGVIGGMKLCSHTKMIYRVGGDKSKDKNKSDFNISPFRWGLTARVGYKWIGVFANYYVTPLFKSGMGPELQPFVAGLAFTF